MRKAIKVELNPLDFADSYDDMLDKLHGEFLGIKASFILKECDSIAYDNGLYDYVDSLDLSDMWECSCCEQVYAYECDAVFCCVGDDYE